MFCQNCGNKIREDGKFCSSCGIEVGKIETTTETSTEIATETESTAEGAVFGQIIRFFAILVGALLGYYLGLVLLLFIFAFIAGSWFSKWYIERGHPKMKLIKFIVGLNWVAWVIPPFGVMIGFATLGFADHFPAKRKTFRTLAICGMIASVINAFIGVLTNL